MSKLTNIMAITALGFGIVFSASAANTVRGFDEQQPPQVEINQGPRGFSDIYYKNIKEMKDKAKDKDMVILRGSLVKHLGGEDYEFLDEEKKTISVKLSNKRDWSYIAKDEPIEIFALYNTDRKKGELIVKNARPLGPRDGFINGPRRGLIDGPRHGRHHRYDEDCLYYQNDCPYYR